MSYLSDKQYKHILFGSGKLAEFIIDEINNIDMFDYIVDNDHNKLGNNFKGLIIKAPDGLRYVNYKQRLIVIASSFYKEIKLQLEGYGLKEGVEFINYDLFLALNSQETQELIQYPKEINFPVTNKCNFRCAMCNVWKPENSAHKDLTPIEIKNLFSKKLFKEVGHVGISGGEPFVRKDILEVVQAITESLDNLKSISIITNCSMEETLEKSKEIKSYLNGENIHFSIQVSIDGVGEVHSKNRGKDNAFELMYSNFKQLIKEKMVNEISTTITKNNINYLWDTYSFARKHDVYIRYRLATEIARLYNNDLTQNFTFSEREKLILIKFFENLIGNYEKNLKKKLFYLSLIQQLKGKRRIVGCNYQTSKSVSLDPYGNLYFCFPKSKSIGNINNDKSYDLDFLEENKTILENTITNCNECIHDYNGPYNNKEINMMISTFNKNEAYRNENIKFLEQYKNNEV